MPIILSILRGINVSGQKKLPMKELKELYEELGFGQATTYIQSGNVVFDPGKVPVKNIASLIGTKIKARYDFDVLVLLRTLPELEAVVARNPFLKEPGIATDKLHVTFLDAAPAADLVQKTEALDFGADRFRIIGREVYVYCPDGYGNTKINNGFFENRLKVVATTRNWKTVNILLGMMRQMEV